MFLNGGNHQSDAFRGSFFAFPFLALSVVKDEWLTTHSDSIVGALGSVEAVRWGWQC